MKSQLIPFSGFVLHILFSLQSPLIPAVRRHPLHIPMPDLTIQRSNNLILPLQEIRTGQIRRNSMVGDECTIHRQVLNKNPQFLQHLFLLFQCHIFIGPVMRPIPGQRNPFVHQYVAFLS